MDHRNPFTIVYAVVTGLKPQRSCHTADNPNHGSGELVNVRRRDHDQCAEPLMGWHALLRSQPHPIPSILLGANVMKLSCRERTNKTAGSDSSLALYESIRLLRVEVSSL